MHDNGIVRMVVSAHSKKIKEVLADKGADRSGLGWLKGPLIVLLTNYHSKHCISYCSNTCDS